MNWKSFALLAVIGFTALQLKAQERVRRDYRHVVIKAPAYPEKEGEYNGYNIFILNYNEHGDLMHITEDREEILYVRTSVIEEAEHNDGVEFYAFEALDEDGETVLIMIYKEEKYGLIIFTGLSEEEPDVDFQFINLD